MTLPVVWLPEADTELQEARAWYDDIRPELGERFARAVEAALEEIAEHPKEVPGTESPVSRNPMQGVFAFQFTTPLSGIVALSGQLQYSSPPTRYFNAR
jgi:plasmid stabilization system protein ParE